MDTSHFSSKRNHLVGNSVSTAQALIPSLRVAAFINCPRCFRVRAFSTRHLTWYYAVSHWSLRNSIVNGKLHRLDNIIGDPIQNQKCNKAGFDLPIWRRTNGVIWTAEYSFGNYLPKYVFARLEDEWFEVTRKWASVYPDTLDQLHRRKLDFKWHWFKQWSGHLKMRTTWWRSLDTCLFINHSRCDFYDDRAER